MVSGREAQVLTVNTLFGSEDGALSTWSFESPFLGQDSDDYFAGANVNGTAVHVRDVWSSMVAGSENPTVYVTLAHVLSDRGEAYVILAGARHAHRTKTTVLCVFQNAEAARDFFEFCAARPSLNEPAAASKVDIDCEALSTAAALLCLAVSDCTNPLLYPNLAAQQQCQSNCAAIGNAVLQACQALEDTINDILDP